MSSQYKANNFSTQNFSLTTDQNKMDKIVRPNIDHLIKKILDEKKQERKKIRNLGVIFFSTIAIYIFLQN
jgi:hypothetical protein